MVPSLFVVIHWNGYEINNKTSAKALDAVFQIAGVQVCRRVNLGLVENVRL